MQDHGPYAFDPGYLCARAVSSEGKIQVELAQLKYRASRLSGLGTIRFPVSAAESVREDRERKSWKPTGA